MMPKGVEHPDGSAHGFKVAGNVKIPMMPKGVEHVPVRSETRTVYVVVKIPMMPKGVEHKCEGLAQSYPRAGEDSNDAERR